MSYISSYNGTQIDSAIKNALALYPVGAIYISTSSTSPASIFGGTWESLKDRVLIGAGNTYSSGATGGAANHTHTSAAHTHTVAGHTHSTTAVTLNIN